MTEEEFEQYLVLGYESRSHEFKAPGPRSDKWLFGRVLRAMMGMANMRDGGLVILGVAENRKTPEPVGLSKSDLKTWNFDDLAAGVAPYAAPNIRFDREVATYNNRSFLVLRIHEFEDVPIICRKELQVPNSVTGKNEVILKIGGLYVRSRSKPETVPVSTEADMRDVIELATDKEVVRFIRRTSRLGFTAPNQDRERFDIELGDFR